jgi:hypothetical protein
MKGGIGYVLASAALLAAGVATAGVDLGKIERTIAREPAYHSGSPKYCLLVFGPEAKTRVWLVLDGKDLYADRTGKGDRTGPGKLVKNLSPKNPKISTFRTGPILAKDGKTRYPNLFVRVWHGARVVDPVKVFLQLSTPAELDKAGADRQRCSEEREVLFADRPRDAPIVHFDGPLTFRLEDPRQAFVRGTRPSPLPVLIGTPGLGRGTFAFLIFDSRAPAGVATIEFPSRHAGGKPIVVQVPLQPPK